MRSVGYEFHCFCGLKPGCVSLDLYKIRNEQLLQKGDLTFDVICNVSTNGVNFHIVSVANAFAK